MDQQPGGDNGEARAPRQRAVLRIYFLKNAGNL
jgi:hypothetical protein